MQAIPQAPSIQELRLFDSCVTLGYMTAGVPALTTEAALAVMDKHDWYSSLVNR